MVSRKGFHENKSDCSESDQSTQNGSINEEKYEGSAASDEEDGIEKFIDTSADDDDDDELEDEDEVKKSIDNAEESGSESDQFDEEASSRGNKRITGDTEFGKHSSTVVSKRRVHKLSLNKSEDFNEKLRKRGVIYVARVPPRMTPTKIKKLLGDFGEVTRVYLVEEDIIVRKRRRRQGGNGSKRYLEGWVEFASKKVAKHVAASLNNTIISNDKHNPHYGDLWNLKYLSRFKWSHLTEKVAYERRVREQKLRLETMQAKRETANYKRLIETGQKLDKIEERKKKRAERSGGTKQPPEQSATTKPPMKRREKKGFDDNDKPTKKALLGALM